MKSIFSISFTFLCLLGFSQNSMQNNDRKENFVAVVSYEKESFPPTQGLEELPQVLQDMAKSHKNAPEYYELLFNDTEALYRKIDKKTEPQQDEMNTGNIQMKVTKVSVSTPGEMYKNYKTKASVDSRKILDKEFLISENLKKMDWELINETKTIGSLECKKAQIKKGDDITEAWYAPNIPTMAGPSIYWGLPGLIVDVRSKTSHYTAIQIKENGVAKIVEPTKGKKVNKQEFTKLEKERLNEMIKDKAGFRIVNE